ncbi:ArnT family glycosyltransferase [Phaeovulum vinaykumarii]|uniref:4-amino-4-deoxy-L-arabinose transferase n=1 Tax=Phaeovulum vinaykumarii TaxID=407234 RepID=A0A1N7KZP1_9RHOB|nr:glycosyltransferase family 39 protein [Phaeovulum vinaykumarii]SIS67007.1 4-amino-4-deoxy-L-arabinose transferase [Phaeovulum vinaykumarii]SOC00884.1 4-amino-4-deoxy-L-arabinose transferase-like glycosyltransferase [Phaeovulum vinaykumarii]
MSAQDRPEGAGSGLAAGVERGLARAPRAVGAAILVVVSLLVMWPGFTSLPPLDRDEARFAQASRQMLDTGDFIDIRFQDQPRYKKPVGIYWLQSAAVAATGTDRAGAAPAPIWAYRLPSLAAAVGAVLLTARIAAQFAAPPAGLVAGLLMTGVFSLDIEANLAKSDAALLFFILLSQAALARAWRRAAAQDFARPVLSAWTVAAFWGGLGAATLIKGPIGPMVTALTVLALVAVARRGAWLAALRPLAGLGLWALIVLPWVVAITVKSGGEFWAASLGHDMMGKVTGVQESHGAPPGSYLAALWVTFFPASVALALAAGAIWRARALPGVIFAAAWAIPGWLVFEASPTKLTHYVLPFYPALALAIALVWPEVVARARRRRDWLIAGGIAALPVAGLIAAGVYAARLGPVPLGPLALGLAVLALGGLIAARALAGHRPVLAALGLAVMGAGFSGGALGAVAQIEALWPAPRILALAQDRACPAPPIFVTSYQEPSLVFLSPGPVRWTAPETAAQVLDTPCARLVADSAAPPPAGGRALGRVTGLNLGSGRAVDLTVWAQAAP